MKTIVIKTQIELDALPAKFDEYTIIEIRSSEHINVVTAWGNSQVTAWENSKVTARENSKVTARENSKVTAWGNSQVTAWENSKVTAWGNSQVTAWGNSQVTAWGNSKVTAWGNSQVTARENSKVTARENSKVTAWGNSQVTAWENSQVTAWGNSKLHAYDCTLLTIFSAAVVVQKLLDLAIAVFEDNTNPSVKERAKTARIIRRKSMTHTRETFARRCEPGESKGSVILFKSVRDDGTDFYTGQIKYEGEVKCPDFDPNPKRQCGGGLHLSPTPEDALNYHTGKLLRCEVKIKDIVVFPTDITKVRCKRVKVLGPVVEKK